MGEFVDREALVVVGAPFSGTSLMAGILQGLGADLGKSLSPPTTTHMFGEFKNMMVEGITDSLSYMEEKNEQHIVDSFERVIMKEYDEDQPLMVVHSELVTRAIPYWHEALLQCSIYPKYIIMVRNPLEVAAEIRKTTDWKYNTGMEMWDSFMRSAMRDTNDKERCFVSYVNLLDDWLEQIGRLMFKLEVRFPKENVLWSPKNPLVSSSERSFQYGDGGLPEWVKKFYLDLLEATET